MMDDLISRQAAINAFYQYPNIHWTTLDVMEKIDKLPSAQPERETGKWVRTRTMLHDGELYCDQCDQEHPEQKRIWNYCPNCGARMNQTAYETKIKRPRSLGFDVIGGWGRKAGDL